MLKPLASLAFVLVLAACNQGPAKVTQDTPIRDDGVGAVAIGMTKADAEKATGQSLTIHNNEDAMGECVMASFAEGPKDLSFMLIKGVIARADVYEGVMRTAEGVGIGSTEDEVKKAYASAKVETLPHKYTDGHYLEVTLSGKTQTMLIFETDGTKVTAFRGGRLPEVGFVEGCA